ncbi:hypothetical protein [Pedobacter steynii]|uniref:Uncharacterized protein n=1 Tax=Pedobacter steynii TaxID=430522 RepID=A0A1D7QNC1_9SPHI|nr:hypothetical protein [Pedobacter steynii]AOM80172.1 hypothetical protein BFS30_25225 [Pedobacter steynii]
MKESNDQKIQEMLEKGIRHDSQHSFENDDLLVYKQLFQALNAGQESGLPANFASNVTKKVQKTTYQKQDMWFALTIILIFAVTFGAAYLVLTLINPDAGRDFYEMNLRFKYVILLGILTFLGIFYDKGKAKVWS